MCINRIARVVPRLTVLSIVKVPVFLMTTGTFKKDRAILMPTAHTSVIIVPSLVACRGIATYCRGSLVVSNLPAQTNDEAIKSCPIGVGECFMSLTT